MKQSDILLKPKYLESENEALRATIETISVLVPGTHLLDRMRANIERNEKEIIAIQTWVENIPEPFIKDCIKEYQFVRNWSQVNYRIYGYPSYHTCRNAVMRYLNKTDFFERFG